MTPVSTSRVVSRGVTGITRISTDESAQAAIDAEVQDLTHSIITLKSRRNEFCFINKLPPEIATHIFHRVRAGVSRRRWIVVTHVCRHWRRMALECPSLWGSVSLARTRRQELNAFMARAKTTPLTVDIPMSLAEEIQLVKDFICDHLSRVRELSILTWPAVRVDLNDIFMAPAPLLETLSVTGMDWSAFGAVDFNLGDYYPALKCLKIIRHSLKWGPQSIRGLRILVLGYIHRGYQPTISALIAILHGCPALAKLSLHEAGPVPDTQQVSGSISPVNLPCLQELNLTLDAQACAAFLSHMTVPSTLRWNIHCNSCISEEVREVVPRSQPGHIICTSLTITFSSLSSEFGANMHPVGEECGLINTSLELRSNYGLESKVWFSICAWAFDNTCWRTTTNVTLLLSNRREETRQTLWSSFFAALPNLNKLTVGYVVRDTTYRYFTTDLPFLPCLKMDKSEVDSAHRCLCPNLSYLRLDGFYIGRDGTKPTRRSARLASLEITPGEKNLREFLQDRHSHKSPLKKLKLENCEGLKRELLDEMKGWVDELDWGGSKIEDNDDDIWEDKGDGNRVGDDGESASEECDSVRDGGNSVTDDESDTEHSGHSETTDGDDREDGG